LPNDTNAARDAYAAALDAALSAALSAARAARDARAALDAYDAADLAQLAAVVRGGSPPPQPMPTVSAQFRNKNRD